MNKSKCEFYDLTKELKKNYQINRDISKYLTNSQQAELLSLLENNQAVSQLIKVLIAQNKLLGKNNQKIGKQRNNIEKALKNERERNEKLITEVTQLKYELNELKVGEGRFSITFSSSRRRSWQLIKL